MKKKKLLAGLLLITGIVLAYLYLFVSKKPNTNNPPAQIDNTSQSEKFLVEQKLTFGEGKNEEKENIGVKEGESVLDIISRTKKVEIKEYSFGKLVESIEGIKNGTNDKYWLFYVNGEEAKVGASDYKLKPTDKVEWKFKTYEE